MKIFDAGIALGLTLVIGAPLGGFTVGACIQNRQPTDSACGKAGANHTQPCMNVLLEDGDCKSISTGRLVGLDSSENYQKNCKYQKRRPQNGVCVDDGPVRNYEAECTRAAGDSCGGTTGPF